MTAPLPRARQYDEALLYETHEALRVSFARFGIDGEKPHGRRVIPGDELGGAGFGNADPASGVFPVVKPEDGAIAKIDRSPAAAGDAPVGPSAGPSSVHTLDRSRQRRAATEDSAESDQNPALLRRFSGPLLTLLRARVLATRSVREARAEALQQRAKHLRRQKRRFDWSEHDIRVRRVGAWHESRARNLLQVFEVVQSCQLEKTVVVSCGACGSVTEAPCRCRRHFFCVPCRGKIATEKRAKLWKALVLVHERAGHRGLLRELRRGGRWGFKMLTLTAPHCARHGTVERADMFCRALPVFERRLRLYLKELEPKNLDCVAWSRALEWEPTPDDAAGHPHSHMILLVPYLDHRMLREWWLDALEAQGYEPADFNKTHVHIVPAVHGRGAVAEVIKYIFKDIDGKGRAIEADTFARAYAALEGRRVTQCSRGLMKMADVKTVCSCGAAGCFSVKLVDGVRGELRPGVAKARPSAEPKQVGGVG